MTRAASGTWRSCASFLLALTLLGAGCDGGADALTDPSQAVKTPPPPSPSTTTEHLTPAATIHLVFPQDLEVAFGSVWTANEHLDGITRIDARTLDATAIPLGAGFSPEQVEAAGGTVWVSGEGGLIQLDPKSGDVMTRIDGAFSPLATGFGSLWAGSLTEVLKVDPKSGEIVATIPSRRCWVTTGGGSVWISCGDSVKEVDPDSLDVVGTVKHGGDVVAAGGALWLMYGRDIFNTQRAEDTFTDLLRIDPATNEPIPGSAIELVRGAAAGFPLVRGDRIWFPVSNGVSPDVGNLLVFDATTGTVIESYDLSEGRGYGFNAVAVGFGSVWTASGVSDRVRRWMLPIS